MNISGQTTGIEGIELLPSDLLIQELKNNSKNLSNELQGYYMLRLKDLLDIKLNREVGELINQPPSYVSARIRDAKESLLVPGKQGRRTFKTYDLDKIIGNDIPLRIQSKIGIVPIKDLGDMLSEIATELEQKDINVLPWKEVNKDQVEEKKTNRGRPRYVSLTHDLDQLIPVMNNGVIEVDEAGKEVKKPFLNKRYPLRIISKDNEIEKDVLVCYLEEAALRLLKLANEENYDNFINVN